MDSPSLRFRRAAWDKLVYFRDKQDMEVSMFAITNVDDPLLVEDVRLVEQECAWATTEMSQEGIADLIDKLTDEGIPIRNISRVWCHTHPGESPNPSNTDEETFKREFGALDWAVMFILAKKGAMYCRFKQNTWPALEMEIPVYVVAAKYDRTNDDAEFERCVKKKTYGTPNNVWINGVQRTTVGGGTGSTAPFHDKGKTQVGSTLISTVTIGPQTSKPVLGFNRIPTKKERRYINLHGTIDGYVHPKGCHMEPLKILPAEGATTPVKIEKLETERSLIPFVEQSETYDLDQQLEDDAEDLVLNPVELQAEVDDIEQSIGGIQDEIIKVHQALHQTMKFNERVELQDYLRELQLEQRDNRASLYDAKRLLKAVLARQSTEQSDEEALKEAYAEYATREGEESPSDNEDTEMELAPLSKEEEADWIDSRSFHGGIY